MKEDKDNASSPFPELTRIEQLMLHYHQSLRIFMHVLIFTLSLMLAFLIWYDAGPAGRGESQMGTKNWFTDIFLPLLPYFLAIKILLFWRMKLLRGGWQYTGIRDVIGILVASWFFVLITAIAMFFFKGLPQWFGRQMPPYIGDYFAKFPKGVLVLDFLATVFMVCMARLGYRFYREEMRPISDGGTTRVLIVGAGDAAETIIREIHRMRTLQYHVVGLVDDDPRKKGFSIHGYQVLGDTNQIAQICKDKDVEEIIIAMPSASQKDLRRVIEQCSGTKLKFQSLPGVKDLINGKVMVSQIRPVDINDLLGREVAELDIETISSFIRGRTLLITGAGGSIGSEMCRQVCQYQPKKLVLLEQAETPLFDIENELRRKFPEQVIAPVICDIYDRHRVMEVWEKNRPEVVVHAAAHKHVPLMELNPCEAVKNNILGTKNVADASCRFKAAEFVTISTDKAVNPSSVMGCSKRVGEIYTQSLNGQDDCPTQFKAVRFGNVLGSNGSVIPTFRRQIAEGGPVTVTHPEMTRYFMTIPEAAQLVLQAAATGKGGQIFLLDMGEPVRIADLARQMITLSGFRPGEDIDIVYSGVRPGEKLFEELKIEGEDIEPTVHSKVMVWAHSPLPWEKVQQYLQNLTALQNCMDREKIVRALQDVVPEYDPLNPPKPEAVPSKN